MKRLKLFMAKLRAKILRWFETKEYRQLRQLEMRVDQLIADFDARGALLVQTRAERDAARDACRLALNAFERGDAIDWEVVANHATPLPSTTG